MSKELIKAPAVPAPVAPPAIDPAEYGVTEETAKKIEAQFLPMISALSALEKEFFEIKGSPDLTEKAVVVRARRLRLKYGELRRLVAEIHKQQKAYFLNGGRFVDAFKNVQTFACTGREDALEAIEKAEEIRREKERLRLQATRSDLLRGLVADPDRLDLGNMAADVFDAYLIARRKEYADAVAAAQAAAEAAALQAAAEAAERERLREENKRQAAELAKAQEAAAEIARAQAAADAKAAAERAAAEAELRRAKEEHDAELAKAQAEREAADRERAKAEEARSQAEQRAALLEAEKRAADVRIIEPRSINSPAEKGLDNLVSAIAAAQTDKLTTIKIELGGMTDGLKADLDKYLDDRLSGAEAAGKLHATAAAINFLEGAEPTEAELLTWIESFATPPVSIGGYKAGVMIEKYSYFIEYCRWLATAEV